jgi:hypothetical protein
MLLLDIFLSLKDLHLNHHIFQINQLLANFKSLFLWSHLFMLIIITIKIIHIIMGQDKFRIMEINKINKINIGNHMYMIIVKTMKIIIKQKMQIGLENLMRTINKEKM